MSSESPVSPDRVSGSGILLLGGSGFIGTRLAALLREQRVQFRIGDLNPSEAFPDLWAKCDVRQLDPVSKLGAGAGAIVNFAAIHRDDVRPLYLYRETNVDGASQVCNAARRTGAGRIVFISSVAVYGFQPVPVDEHGPFDPFNEYGKTKLEAESIYRSWAEEDPSRSLVIVRPSVVFGEGNRGNVYNLLHQIAAGRFMMVGDGKNIKSMAYVGNLAAFLLHILGMGPGTHIFNYVDVPDMNTRSLVEHIRYALNQNGPIRKIPRGVALCGGSVLDAVAHLTGRTFPVSAVRVRKFCENTQFLARRIDRTGFVRPYSLREGLDRTIRFEFASNTDIAREDLAASPR